MRHLRFAVTAAVVSAAALTLASCAGDGGGSVEYDPDADVTLTFAFWGNDDRAERYNQLIEAFQTDQPNITVNTTFTDFPSYWEKRQTEVAGGGLPPGAPLRRRTGWERATGEGPRPPGRRHRLTDRRGPQHALLCSG